MTILYRGLVSGQYVYWDGNTSTPVGATDIIQVVNTETLKYPDIDTNTILAWTFSGSSGNIPNLGTAGSGADIVNIGASVVRNVPGPISSGVGYAGPNAQGGLWTAQGSGAALGSGNFTDKITLTVFFDLGVSPTAGASYQRLIVKGYENNGFDEEPYWGACIEWLPSNNTLYGGVGISTTGTTRRTASVAPGQVPGGIWGWRAGYHMASYTYDGTTSTLYFDGVQVSSTNHGSSANILMSKPGGEGPWNFGSNYVGTVNPTLQGANCVMYHARVDNVVKSAEWVRKAWNNFNGW